MADLLSSLTEALSDRYVPERELGGGGMSRVFLATERALARRVVIKVLPPDYAQGLSTDRFRREIQLVAQLQHPHIVPLLTAGEVTGLLYYSMPYVEGESLRTRLARGPLATPEAVRILRDVASALAFAHQHGVVHRDVKPDNVLLAGDSAAVADFGIAKAVSAAMGNSATLTQDGLSLGTPAYMAPEQASGGVVDGRADLYSLGAMAYEMLTGEPPFARPSVQAVLVAHAIEKPVPLADRRPEVSPLLAGLVMRLLQKRPDDRPESADEVARALDAVATPSGGSQTLPIVPSRRRHRWRVLVAATAGVALALMVTVGKRGIRGGATLVSAGKLPRRAPVILAEFAPHGTDSTLAVVATEALRSDLAQSQAVVLVPPSAVSGALARMRRPQDARLDPALARAVAQREGIAAIVAGDVTAVGGRTVLSVRIIRPETGEDLAAFREVAADSSDILPALDRVAKAVH